MKTEMDLLRMDERQRLCWLRANRVVLMIVGAIWICMIGWELLHDRIPYFMIIAVPLLALTRLALYKYFVRKG
jgi:hypothetical protein